jgi:hypothetical protein
MNNCSILSTNAERKITDLSVKHSFTLYPSLSPYSRTEWLTETKYTCCAWAGGTFFQLCFCVSLLFWREIGFGFTYLRTLLNKLFYELIFFLIVVEVLRFLVRQCVVSFHSHFQYGLLLILTPRSSDPRSKHQHYSSCKQQHCYCLCLVDPSSSLLAAVTIVAKKRLVNSISYFSSILLLLE